MSPQLLLTIKYICFVAIVAIVTIIMCKVIPYIKEIYIGYKLSKNAEYYEKSKQLIELNQRDEDLAVEIEQMKQRVLLLSQYSVYLPLDKLPEYEKSLDNLKSELYQKCVERSDVEKCGIELSKEMEEIEQNILGR